MELENTKCNEMLWHLLALPIDLWRNLIVVKWKEAGICSQLSELEHYKNFPVPQLFSGKCR